LTLKCAHNNTSRGQSSFRFALVLARPPICRLICSSQQFERSLFCTRMEFWRGTAVGGVALGMLDGTWICGLLLHRRPVGYRDCAIDADRVHIAGRHHDLRYAWLSGQDQEHVSILGNVAQDMRVISGGFLL